MSGVYKLLDRGQPVGVFTAKEIAEKLGCCDQTVFKYERSGKKWKDRWTIEYREKQNTERAAVGRRMVEPVEDRNSAVEKEWT